MSFYSNFKLMILVLFSTALILCFIGCSDSPPPILTKDMKKELDSLFTISKDSLIKEMELECEKRFTSIYQNAIDSIQDLREEEILNLVN